jgi:hypothetical protein
MLTDVNNIILTSWLVLETHNDSLLLSTWSSKQFMCVKQEIFIYEKFLPVFGELLHDNLIIMCIHNENARF